MLNRRKRIQRSIAYLKQKQLKKTPLQKHLLLKYKIDHINKPIQTQQLKSIQHHTQKQKQQPCWYDPDDIINQQEIQLGKKNKYNKLFKFGMKVQPTINQYETKLNQFYCSKYKKYNWAQQAQDIQQKDINDYLNEQIYFNDKKRQKKQIKFITKTSSKHQSIISGLQWKNNVMFSCGLDHKIKIWHFKPQETNPQLKIQLEKDIFVQDLPLSNCFYRNNSLLLGSYRKSLVQVDTEKWTSTFITSSFLKDHKTYQNLRISPINNYSSIFSDKKISILDKNNIYVGNLLTNDKIEDISFGYKSQYSIFAITNDSIYQWDLKKFNILRMEKKYLGFTSISVSGQSINVGSKLGTVYFYNPTSFQNSVQNNNLLTHITQIQSSKNGELCVALSRWKTNAVRVIDQITGKSIPDWPSVQTKIGYPMYSSFNQQNYLSIGESHGYSNIYGIVDDMI